MRSVRNKFHKLEKLLFNNDIDILCLTETWLRSDVVFPVPTGYKMYRIDREMRGGGVAILVKVENQSRELELCKKLIVKPTSMEVLGISVQIKKYTSYNIICMYRTMCIGNDLNNIENLIQQFSLDKKLSIITGDFNLQFHLQET